MSGMKDIAKAAGISAGMFAVSLGGPVGITERSKFDLAPDAPTTSETCRAEDAPSSGDQYLADNPEVGLMAAASQAVGAIADTSKARDEMGEKTDAAPEAEYADTAPPEPDSTYAATQIDTQDDEVGSMAGDYGDDADPEGEAVGSMAGDYGDDADPEGEAVGSMAGDYGDEADMEGGDLGDDGADSGPDGEGDGGW